MPVTALANAPLGEQHTPLKLRYQACSSELCLPPVTLTLDLTLNVAASASVARPPTRRFWETIGPPSQFQELIFNQGGGLRNVLKEGLL